MSNPFLIGKDRVYSYSHSNHTHGSRLCIEGRDPKQLFVWNGGKTWRR